MLLVVHVTSVAERRVAVCPGRQAVIESGGSVAEAFAHVPDATSRVLQRELAAIHRCVPEFACMLV